MAGDVLGDVMLGRATDGHYRIGWLRDEGVGVRYGGCAIYSMVVGRYFNTIWVLMSTLVLYEGGLNGCSLIVHRGGGRSDGEYKRR